MRGVRPWMMLAAACLASACGGSSGIDLDTTCAEYLGYSDDARGIAVRTLGVELGWAGAGNPMSRLSFDGHCSQRPNQTMRQAIDLFAGN